MRYAHVIWAGRGWVLIGMLVTAGILALVSFAIPPTYQAVSTLIPVTSPDKGSALAQFGVSLDDFGLQTAPTRNTPAMYPEIIRSRRLLEQALSTSFSQEDGGKPVSLIEIVQPRRSGPKRMELAVKRLRAMVDASLDRRTGILSIRVSAHRPEVAAGLANALDTLLMDFTVNSFTTQVAENRKFIQGRLEETQNGLARAEDELRAFRERNLRIGNSPRLLLEEGRLVRALREQEEIYLTLRRQYELARIEERRDVPVINVLDPAVATAFRTSPSRGYMIAWGAVVGAVGVSALLVWRQRYSA